MLPFYATAQTRESGDKLSFIIEDAYGNKTDVAQQKNKVVFINFWSLTCIPCKAEMPTINNLRNHYKDDTDLLVYTVDLDHNYRADYDYFVRKGYSLGIYAPAGVVPTSLFQGEIPTTVVLDKSGGIAFLHTGREQYDTPEFYRIIDSLLGK